MQNSTARRSIFASVITIGDELLIGQTVDTNSAWIAQEMNKLGIWVRRRVAVGDRKEEIITALEEESKGSQVILITGGLGPTADDITKPLLCAYFGGKLIVDQQALANVRNIFENILKRPLIERNLKQAEVPDVCTVIQNKRGTAPGMWFEKDGVIFVSMPGVPHEMKGMMTGYVIPALQSHFSLNPVLHRTLLTAGIGESFLAERIALIESALPHDIKLAYLPNYGMVRLRLTATGDRDGLEADLEQRFTNLKEALADVLVTDKDIPMEQVVGDLLRKKNKTLGTAESCTGGFIAHMVTSVPGSSSYYIGSVVSYDNAVKRNILGVSGATLESYGAVSRETATEMVKGALNVLGTDYVLVTTGIMGPDGGTPEKPVGTVWIGLGSAKKIETYSFHFRFDRKRNMELTAISGLNALRKFIQQELPD